MGQRPDREPAGANRPAPECPAHSWAGLLRDAWLLGAEASLVVPLRLTRLALGDEGAKREARRMLNEKLAANSLLLRDLKQGRHGTSLPGLLHGSVRHYLAFVRANRKRLTRTVLRGGR